MANKMPNPQNYLNNNQQPASHPEAGPAFDESAIEEIVEGLREDDLGDRYERLARDRVDRQDADLREEYFSQHPIS